MTIQGITTLVLAVAHLVRHGDGSSTAQVRRRTQFFHAFGGHAPSRVAPGISRPRRNRGDHGPDLIVSSSSCRRTSQSVLWLSQVFMPA